MNILIAASEVFPFSKTGGLADVAGAISQIFSKTRPSAKVAVFLPRYRNTGGGAFSLKAVPGSFLIPVGDGYQRASLSKFELGKVSVYFVENAKYFDRDGLYRGKTGDYPDNDERFIFFSRAVLEGAKFAGFKPDIIHCNDWQTALIPAYLKTLYLIDAFFARTRTLLTIHNMAFQGYFPKETFVKAGFNWADYTPAKLEYYGGINFLKAGIVYADFVNTVSPAYAKESLSRHEIGKGLAGVLKSRGNNFKGILNGIDTEVWDPEFDSFIAENYNGRSFAKAKAVCKAEFRKEHGLAAETDKMLCALIARLDSQKGVDLVLKAIEHFAGKMQFAILGTGGREIEKSLMNCAQKHKGDVFFKPALDEVLAHKLYGAADVFLMPSRFEPCGLTQMIAMRYGAVPIASKTGGLADTINGYGEADAPNGFFLPSITGKGLISVMDSARSAFENKKLWNFIIKNAMKTDFSWDKSAREYLSLFDKLLAGR